MKKFFSRIYFLMKVHRSIPFIFDFFRSKEISIFKKIVSLGVIIGYFVIPFDMIPDVMLLFGWVDDFSVLIFILQLIVSMAPISLKEKYDLRLN